MGPLNFFLEPFPNDAPDQDRDERADPRAGVSRRRLEGDLADAFARKLPAGLLRRLFDQLVKPTGLARDDFVPA